MASTIAIPRRATRRPRSQNARERLREKTSIRLHAQRISIAVASRVNARESSRITFIMDWHNRVPVSTNPIVFFYVAIGGAPIGRITFELFADVAPRAAENFRQMCTGEFRSREGEPRGYKNVAFHRVIPDFMIQGGDIVKGDGTGSISIYGTTFADEPFVGKHTGAGLLSSANSGPDTNGCQFFVTCAKTEWLDGKHVVFGRVLGDGLLVVRKIENVATGGGNKPKLPVVITECWEM